MPSIRVNFSDVNNFDPLPAGVYPVVVTGVEVREPRSANKDGETYPYLNWELTIEEGEYEDRKLWTITSLNPKAMWKLQEALVAFGEDKEELGEDFDLYPENYIGAKCNAAVIQEAYNGKMKNTVEDLAIRDGVASKSKSKGSASGPAKPGLKFK